MSETMGVITVISYEHDVTQTILMAVLHGQDWDRERQGIYEGDADCGSATLSRGL